MSIRTCASMILSLVFAGTCGAATYPKYYLNKESRKNSEGLSPALRDASYWNNESGEPGTSGGALDTNGDYIVRTYKLQSDLEQEGKTPTFDCHSLILGEVGGASAAFDCYYARSTKWSVGGEGLVFANGKVSLEWKPVTVDAKVTVTAPAETPFVVFSQYADTKVTFAKSIVSAEGAGLYLYDKESTAASATFTVELKGDYSQYFGELKIGKAIGETVKPNDLYLSGEENFPGKVVLLPTGRLQIGAADLVLNELSMDTGSTLVFKGGSLAVKKAFALTGDVNVALSLTDAEIDALLDRHEYGEIPVLTIPAASQISAENFKFVMDAHARVASVTSSIRTNHDGTKSICCRLIRPCVYVKPTGDNSASGVDSDHALRTLAYAVSQLTDGVIYAMEGTYAEGLCDEGEGVTHSRVHVPTNVVLKALGDVKKTIILGAHPSDATKLFGEGATRCVRLDSGAMIQGFTLTGGYGYASKTEVSGDRFSNQAGGAVRGRGDSLVVDCIITNNIARNGGGVQGGRYVRCLLKGNYSLDDNGAKSQWQGRDGFGYGGTGEKASYSYFFNCLFDSREDRSVLVYNFCYLYNCTFTGTTYVSPQNSCFLYNCIVPGSTLLGGNTVCYYNCLLGSDPDKPKAKEGCEVVEDWSTVLDASYRPLAGGAAVDAGNTSVYQAAYPSEVDSFDYFGGQRVYSEVIDIGCAEYDARSAFGKILARSRAMVVSASAEVKASDDGNGLVVSAGETLEVEYDSIGKGETAEVRFETEISGGVLTVYLDGQLWATVSDGKQVLTFAGNQSVRRLSFSYAGTDSATIGSFCGNGGLMLIFR